MRGPFVRGRFLLWPQNQAVCGRRWRFGVFSAAFSWFLRPAMASRCPFGRVSAVFAAGDGVSAPFGRVLAYFVARKSILQRFGRVFAVFAAGDGVSVPFRPRFGLFCCQAVNSPAFRPRFRGFCGRRWLRPHFGGFCGRRWHFTAPSAAFPQFLRPYRAMFGGGGQGGGGKWARSPAFQETLPICARGLTRALPGPCPGGCEPARLRGRAATGRRGRGGA